MVTKKVGTQKAGTAKVTGQAARQATAKVAKATTKAATSRGGKAAAKQVAQTLYAVALERAKEALTKATIKTWEQAQNAIFGPGGAVHGLFVTEDERRAFLASDEGKEIKKLVSNFPRSDEVSTETANGRILVRVPKSVHVELLNEASREGVSLNQLCVAKLSRPLGSFNQH